MLPRKNRISRKDFPTPKERGFRVFSPLFTIVFYQSPEGVKESRASIVVSKKTAKTAVVRNTLRRRFYELLAPHFKKINKPIVAVVYPKVDAEKAAFSSLALEMEKVFKQAPLEATAKNSRLGNSDANKNN